MCQSRRQQKRSGSLRKEAYVVSARGVVEHALIVSPVTEIARRKRRGVSPCFSASFVVHLF
jgi:hypothetical protein